MEDSALLLKGTRVCDFSWYAASPIATKHLAHFGAEVIKMEYSGHPDLIRLAMPQAPGKEGDLSAGGWFNNQNPDKLCLGLNLGHPRAKEVYDRLILASDIVCENFSPEMKERLGLNYEDYAAIKPDIIWIDQPMQGLTGPHKYTAGFGAAITPLGGLSYLSGFPHRPPAGTGTNYTDYVINSGQLAIVVFAALRYRKRTGKGRHIVMAQYASAVSILETAILDYTVNHRIQPRIGNRVLYAAPHGCYRCKDDPRDCTYITPLGPMPGTKNDRWCVISVFTDEDWMAFCDVIGNPLWTKDSKFSTVLSRKENEDELDRLVQEWTIQRSPEEVMILMQWGGVPAGVVQDSEDLLTRDPQLRARDYYVYLDHSVTGRSSYDSVAFKLSETPASLTRAAPRIGEHTEFVCKDILGMAEEEIDQYLVEGVLEVG